MWLCSWLQQPLLVLDSQVLGAIVFKTGWLQGEAGCIVDMRRLFLQYKRSFCVSASTDSVCPFAMVLTNFKAVWTTLFTKKKRKKRKKYWNDWSLFLSGHHFWWQNLCHIQRPLQHSCGEGLLPLAAGSWEYAVYTFSAASFSKSGQVMRILMPWKTSLLSWQRLRIKKRMVQQPKD